MTSKAAPDTESAARGDGGRAAGRDAAARPHDAWRRRRRPARPRPPGWRASGPYGRGRPGDEPGPPTGTTPVPSGPPRALDGGRALPAITSWSSKGGRRRPRRRPTRPRALAFSPFTPCMTTSSRMPGGGHLGRVGAGRHHHHRRPPVRPRAMATAGRVAGYRQDPGLPGAGLGEQGIEPPRALKAPTRGRCSPCDHRSPPPGPSPDVSTGCFGPAGVRGPPRHVPGRIPHPGGPTAWPPALRRRR